MKKILLRLILILVILVVVVVAVGLIFINPIAKSGVEKGTTAALGVDTTVDKVSISLLNGQVVLDGLNVSNPEGFITTHLVHTGKFDIQVDPGSLFSDTVEIRKFELDGVDLHIEQKLPTSNISKIMDYIKGSSKDDAKKKDTPSKTIHADRILVKNVTAHFHLLTSKSSLDVKVPQIVITNFTSDKPGGIAGQLASQLFPAILASVLQEAQGLVPTDFLNDLDSQVLDLAKGLGDETIKQAAQAVEKTTEILEKTEIDKPLEDAGKTVEKGLGDLTEGLFGGKKEDSE